ncbi:SET domain-containing protein [Massarina eburnea CBS 473.64]|uniref:SET domain-containing protein n=1 Tax=Massarina eburnea CBS 473.64 TaxID=1395130 RepID=A0A6A6S4T2_9PLEO|nr:SET domain-containing protein [Massarina eburnea CBS 473.64]
MKSVVGLGLLGSALASSHQIDKLPQKPLFADACPSNSILHNGVCQPSSFASDTGGEQITYSGNGSLTLDDARASAQKVADFPWTFWPECYSNENTTEPVCVFSNQEFAGGRGIFIVTTGSLAYKMLNKAAFTDPTSLSRINHHDNPSFVEHEFPGKGRGLIANKTLNRGDQIFASTPLVISHPGSYDLVEAERLRLAHRGVDSLPSASKAKFWKLLDHFKGDPVDDRINTNAFDIEIDGVSQFAVLPEIAMLNHDCRPNAAYFWDEETLSHYVHATQTIHPGEEITITYINNERRRHKRMENLKRNWGFDCTCSSCAAHPSFTAESDDRIDQMVELLKDLDDWTAGSRASPEMVETLISMYEQERLYASMGVAYKHAAEVYSSFGDRYNAIRYARLAAELSFLDKGFRDRDVREMQKMASNPEMTWSWKKRVGHKRASCGHHH